MLKHTRIIDSYFTGNFSLLLLFGICLLLPACSALEKASTHGLSSGKYKMKTKEQVKVESRQTNTVYLDVADEEILVYNESSGKVDTNLMMRIPLRETKNLFPKKIIFKKQGLDVDITSVLLKYRPSVNGSPAQLTTDLNMALYAGWRFDSFHVLSKQDPLGKTSRSISGRGFDFGLFAGPGTTLISPFTTQNLRGDEYNGIIMQMGLAGFIESSMASFGLAFGYDYLLGPDRSIWIYNQKPWLGFIVGIALN